MIHSKFYLIIAAPLLIGFLMIVSTIRLDAQSDLEANGDTYKFTANESYRDRIIPADLDLDEYDEIKFYLRGGDGGRRKVTFFSALGVSSSCIAKGGEGATVKATFSIGYGAGALQPGGTLRFIPGKKGKSKTSNGVWSAGGAGGTAVLYKAPGANITCTLPSTDLADASSCWVILAVAGGGGGAYSGGLCGGQAGKGGNDNTNGRDGYGNPGSGQINGYSAYSYFLPDNYLGVEYVISGGGGGYRPNDENANSSGGAGLFTGGSGGGNDSSVGGGFGYGGGGRGTGDGGGGAGGGGGGGYSGGGGGGSDHKAGGGGGSFVNDAAVTSHKKQGGKDKTPNDGYITYRFKAFNGTRANCQDVVVELDATGLATFVASDADNGSFNSDGLALNFLAFPEDGSLLEDAFETIVLDCSHVGSTTYSMATIPQGDEANADNCTFNLRVEENYAPMAQCKDITLQLDANLTATLTAAEVDNGSYDACGILGQQIDKTTFGCADIGTQIVTLHLEDNNENFSECTALVTIEDYADLSISCPANITTVLDPGQCEKTLNAGLAPVDYSLLCAYELTHKIQNFSGFGGLPLTFSGALSSYDFYSGRNEVTYTLTAEDGTLTTCSFEVMVDDNEAPEALCKNVTIHTEQLIVDLALMVNNGSSDNCDLPFLGVYSLDSYPAGCEDVGENTVVLSVRDNSDNIGTCSATVTVRDNEAPTINCQDVTVQLSNPTLDASGFNMDATDNCTAAEDLFHAITLVSGEHWGSLVPFDCSHIGITDYMVDAIDESGNHSSCMGSITVVDDVAPLAQCQDVTLALDEDGVGSLEVSQLDNNSTGNYNLQFLLSQTDYDCSTIGDHTVILTVTDVNDNSASCSAQVTVVDNTPPVALCQPATVQLNADGIGSLEASQIDNNSSDNCGIATMTLSQTDFDCSYLGDNEVTLSVTDAANNSTTCTVIVVIDDEVPPVVTCEDVTIELTLDEGGFAIGLLHPDEVLSSVYDACSFELPTGTTALDCSDVGSFVQTVWVNDHDNESSCSATVTVIETIPPEARCKNATLQLDDAGFAALELSQINDGSSDHCGLQSLVLSQTDYDCSELGDNTITLTVTDVNDNSASCTAVVTVEDNIPPVITCQDLTFEVTWDMAGTPQTHVPNAAVLSTVYDACLSSAGGPGDNTLGCGEVGSYVQTVSAYDNSGNSSSCSATITVIETTPPQARCKNATILLDETGFATLSVSDIDKGSFDYCGLQSLEISQTSFDCIDVGNHVVELQAMDVNGNAATCTANVSVQGLPCDWTGPEDGIGCPDGSQASYNMATETFAITSAGCYNPAYYRPEDSHGYAGTVLCGDGEIVAHIVGIDGAAWAGVTMRDNLEPNARMIQLLVNNSGLARREVRASTTSAAFVHLFPNNGQHWLRLTRSGNQFGAHISPDGQTWNTVFLVSISMNDCIDVGLTTMNEQPNGPASAFFNEVSVIENGIQPLHGVETNTLNYQDLEKPKMDFGLYPNPTSGKVNLQVEQFIGQKVSIEVFNHLGQSIMQKDKMEALDPLEQLDLRRFPTGTYFVKISTATTSVTKRLAVTKD